MFRSTARSPHPPRPPARTTLRLLGPAVLALCLSAAIAAEKPSAKNRAGGTATVEYVAPERFSDIQLPDSTTEESIKRLLPELTRSIETAAAKRLPAGHSVHIKVRDIDLAGRIAHTAANSPRVVGRNLPAIIEFDYSYTTKTGAPAKTGSQRLSRLPTELDHFTAPSNDLYLIRSMVDSWLKQLAKHKP